MAREFGLVYSLPETVRPIYRSLGINLPEFNDDNTWELPLPGTFVIDQQGVVRLSFVDSDYTKRLEPERILDCFASLENKRMILRD